jgi:multiple sugar transport system substrate-binding protein
MSFAILRRASRTGFVCAAACAVVAILAAGCGAGTPPPEPVTIAFAFPETDLETFEKLVDIFGQEFPHITVELRPKSSDILGGIDVDDSDVLLTSQFAIAWMQTQDRVLNLTPFIEGDEKLDASDFYPGTMGLFTVDGQAWAVPAGVDLMAMYYNEELFDQYGAPYPQLGWTWDDFLVAAASVRDVDADVFGYGPNLQMFDPMLFIYQHGGRIFDDLQNPTRPTFNEPMNIDALNWYFRLMFDLDVAPTAAQAREAFGGSGNLFAGVMQERVGMWTGFLSERGGRLQPPEWPFSWGVVPLPRGNQVATMALVEAYFISADTLHRDAAWQWVSFLSQQLPQRLAPVRRSLAESSAYEQQVGADVAAVTQASMENALLLSPKLAEFEQALGILQRAFAEIAAGRLTPEEAMDWAQQQVE